MLSDILGNKLQEIDLAIVSTMKTQQEVLVELQEVQKSSKYHVGLKRLDNISSDLSQNLKICNKFKFND
jgi:hypothetical protein